MNENQISIVDACALLDVSRPTFDAYREQHQLSSVKVGRQYRFRKNEIIAKIFQHTPTTKNPIDLLMGNDLAKISELLIDPFTLDLRQINLVDGFGMFALMSELYALLSVGSEVNLVIDDSFACRYLCDLNFFKELQRQYPKNLYLSSAPTNLLTTSKNDSFLPLTRVGIKNAQQVPLEQHVLPILQQQGFSDAIAGYIFWMVGELMDNAHTHGKALGHCYVTIHRFGNEKKYLQIDVCDFGIGIPNTIKKSPTHSKDSDQQALIKAFKAGVSSWPAEAMRGKGLSDVLTVAMGNQSLLRVESGGQGFMLSFAGMAKHAAIQSPMATTSGTRISLVLIDQEFREVSRTEADKFVSDYMESL